MAAPHSPRRRSPASAPSWSSAPSTPSRRRTGNSFPTNGREVVVIKNDDAASHTCTIPVNPAAAPDGLAVTSRQVVVPAGTTYVAGPFGPEYQQADGIVYLNWDSATQMTAAVLRLPS